MVSSDLAKTDGVEPGAIWGFILILKGSIATLVRGHGDDPFKAETSYSDLPKIGWKSRWTLDYSTQFVPVCHYNNYIYSRKSV